MTDTFNLSGNVSVPDHETYNDVVINIGSAASVHSNVTLDSHDSAEGSLLIGSAATVNSNAQVFDDLEGYTIVNHGHINVAAGSTLFLEDMTFINRGSVSIAGNGVIVEGGKLDLDGSTLAPEGEGTILLDGTIANGTLAMGTAALIAYDLNSPTLDDVTYKGDLNVNTDARLTVKKLRVESADGAGPGTINVAIDGNLYVEGGLQLRSASGAGAGTINIASGADVTAYDNESFNNIVINLDNGGGAGARFGVGNSGTLGSTVTINSSGSGDALNDFAGTSIVNDGQIDAAGSGLYIDAGNIYASESPTQFINDGTINVAAGSIVDVRANTFAGTGAVSIASGGVLALNHNPPYGYYHVMHLDGATLAPVGAGALEIYDTLSNGAIAPGGVSVTLNGATLDEVTYDGSAASRLFGFGTIENGIANAGTVEANGGTLDIAGAIAGTGKLIIDAAATLELGGTTTEEVDYNGVGTLKLSAPASYTGTLGGVVYGDVIDSASTTVSSATLSGTSLLVTLATGTRLDYALAGTLANGAVTLSSDGASGTDITFTPLAAGSPADFSTMNFIAPAVNDNNAGPAMHGSDDASGVAALAHAAVFADRLKAALGTVTTAIPSGSASGGFFDATFSAAGDLHAVIGQSDFAALLPPHAH